MVEWGKMVLIPLSSSLKVVGTTWQVLSYHIMCILGEVVEVKMVE